MHHLGLVSTEDLYVVYECPRVVRMGPYISRLDNVQSNQTLIQFYVYFACSALTLLVGRQKGHPACKKLSGGVLAWLSVWSEVQMICIWSS